MSQRAIAKRIAEINTELGLLERERTGLVGTYRANRFAEIRSGQTPARDISILRPTEQDAMTRHEALLREHIVADEKARAQGLMTA